MGAESNQNNAAKSDRITEYISNEGTVDVTPKTEIANQPEFYKIPRRFGSIPVDELPLGCDKEEQYYKAYPRIPLPFQKGERMSFGHPTLEPNRLIWGDNLHIMRLLPSNSIDLIYIDPPFFSGRNYNVIFGDQNEVRSFSDIWEGGMPGYLIWLNARLLEMKRLLRSTGSIYVHLDWHASHYVKAEMDKIFGYGAKPTDPGFKNEIIWCYSIGGKSNKMFGRKHDVILVYTKTGSFTFNGDDPEVRVPRKPNSHMRTVLDENGVEWQEKTDRKTGKVYRYPLDKVADDYWLDIEQLNREDDERIGYPTQKPERLLERIISASTKKGDVVADFFCGGGTTPVVAQQLGRKWIACDQSRVAVAITRGRLESLYERNRNIQTLLLPVPDISLEYWGTYEIPSLTEMTDQEFRNFIISAFGGRITSSDGSIHGFKRDQPLFVGHAAQHLPVTKDDVIGFAKELSVRLGKRHGTMLAWSFAPAARVAAEKLMAEGNSQVDLIKISQIEIESKDFREHITRLHSDYESFLRFILPPETRFSYKRIRSMVYSFDVSESVALNEGAKIINVQWDFDFKGRFTPTQGYGYGRDDKGNPLYRTEFKFQSTGRRTVACRIQDDLGGERIHPEVIVVQ